MDNTESFKLFIPAIFAIVIAVLIYAHWQSRKFKRSLEERGFSRVKEIDTGYYHIEAEGDLLTFHHLGLSTLASGNTQRINTLMEEAETLFNIFRDAQP
jgi:hypothetical protein